MTTLISAHGPKGVGGTPAADMGAASYGQRPFSLEGIPARKRPRVPFETPSFNVLAERSGSHMQLVLVIASSLSRRMHSNSLCVVEPIIAQPN